MSGRGFTHERNPATTRDEWYTPPEVFEALGETFDLDPASPGKSKVPWIPAKEHWTRKDDGLVCWRRLATTELYAHPDVLVVSKACHCWYCRKPAVSIWFVGQEDLAYPMCWACDGFVRACLRLRSNGASPTADALDSRFGILTAPDPFRLDGGAWREGPATQHQALAIAQVHRAARERECRSGLHAARSRGPRWRGPHSGAPGSSSQERSRHEP